MAPESQYYVAKNLNDFRDKFAGFLRKFQFNAGNASQDSEKVINVEDVSEFFEEMGK